MPSAVLRHAAVNLILRICSTIVDNKGNAKVFRGLPDIRVLEVRRATSIMAGVVTLMQIRRLTPSSSPWLWRDWMVCISWEVSPSKALPPKAPRQLLHTPLARCSKGRSTENMLFTRIPTNSCSSLSLCVHMQQNGVQLERCNYISADKSLPKPSLLSFAAV